MKKEFDKLFSAYDFPFKSAQTKINSKTKPEQMEYYRQARELTENKTFNAEIESIIRKFYQELALKATIEEQTAYRLTLTLIKQFEERIYSLAGLYHPEQEDRSVSKKL